LDVQDLALTIVVLYKKQIVYVTQRDYLALVMVLSVVGMVVLIRELADAPLQEVLFVLLRQAPPSAVVTLALPAAMIFVTPAAGKPAVPALKTVRVHHHLQKPVATAAAAQLQVRTAQPALKTVVSAQKPVAMARAMLELERTHQTAHSTVVGKSAAMAHVMQALVKTATTAKPTVASALAAATASALWGKTVPTALQTVQLVQTASATHLQKAAPPVRQIVAPVS